MTMRITSFFMGRILPTPPAPGSSGTVVARPPGGGGPDQTVRRSRAPVSEDGCRSFDMARASI